PSLEYERKGAKALLRGLRAGDPDALARARALQPAIDASHPQRIRLADAQLVIAREYGFRSWPRLVRWFGDVERQLHARVRLDGDRGSYEARARQIVTGHREGGTLAGRALAAYVPRFYGLPLDAVFASTVDEADARLAVARMHGAPSWKVLMERVDATPRTPPMAGPATPIRDAIAAMAAGDLDALQRVLAIHPDLLRPSGYDRSSGSSLMWVALGQERRRGAEAMRPILDWLAAQGLDRQRELDLHLRGHIGMTPEEVRNLLDLGADPDWVADNGVPVLEHALVRYWNGEAVDVLAARATPRKALWISAGLGDVEGVRGFLDRDGKPTRAARRLRPDFVAVGPPGFMPQLPDADDEELLLEALLVAMLNGRAEMIEYLAARGAPVNSLIYGKPLIAIATGNNMTAVAEALARAGG
ncbi:MAG TPA: hypothetical protein VIR34_11595, partial [Gemmatimonadaceae bacterium]